MIYMNPLVYNRNIMNKFEMAKKTIISHSYVILVMQLIAGSRAEYVQTVRQHYRIFGSSCISYNLLQQ